ncbi:MAG: O-antigen polymerase [Chthonomonadales bacterium]
MFLSLRYFSPRWVLIWGFVAWAFTRSTLFFMDWGVDFTNEAMLVLAAYVGAFVAGTYLARGKAFDPTNLGRHPGEVGLAFEETLPAEGATPAQMEAAARKTQAIRIAARVLFTIALIFLLLRIYDLLFVRGLLSVGNIQELRNADNTIVGDDRSTSVLGLVSGIGYPMAIPSLIFTIAFKKHLTKWLYRSGIGLFVLYAIYVNLSGSRMILVGPLLDSIVAVAIANSGIKFNFKTNLILVGTFLVVFSILTFGALQRDALFGVSDRDEAVSLSQERRLMTPSSAFVEWFHNEPETVQVILWSWVELAWYNTHGLYEYQKVFDYADPYDRAWGSAEFGTAFYFFKLIGFSVPTEDTWRRNIPTYGFYTSFFGPLYLDFGIDFGIIFMIGLGWIAQSFWLSAIRGQIHGILFYPFFGGLILNFCGENLIMGGLGVPILGVITIAYAILMLSLRWAANKANALPLESPTPAVTGQVP